MVSSSDKKSSKCWLRKCIATKSIGHILLIDFRFLKKGDGKQIRDPSPFE